MVSTCVSSSRPGRARDLARPALETPAEARRHLGHRLAQVAELPLHPVVEALSIEQGKRGVRHRDQLFDHLREAHVVAADAERDEVDGLARRQDLLELEDLRRLAVVGAQEARGGARAAAGQMDEGHRRLDVGPLERERGEGLAGTSGTGALDLVVVDRDEAVARVSRARGKRIAEADHDEVPHVQHLGGPALVPGAVAGDQIDPMRPFGETRPRQARALPEGRRAVDGPGELVGPARSAGVEDDFVPSVFGKLLRDVAVDASNQPTLRVVVVVHETVRSGRVRLAGRPVDEEVDRTGGHAPIEDGLRAVVAAEEEDREHHRGQASHPAIIRHRTAVWELAEGRTHVSARPSVPSPSPGGDRSRAR